ncbi:hypothetical protein [Methylobacterium oxalidis]|uniref:hypothetical protein n=1 Tax=Methylobacterium oxalidis TaxID=944322 RepID=UPI0011BEB7D4|nr:hypothetical protein [Methylobacterium oxalidis]GJE31269.1 hypothetical protein LDDCCGHA_1446 [Methylobacterium oxalidis]
MMKMKFHGSYPHLQKCVYACNTFGDWYWLSVGRLFQFRSIDGEILNWWPSTGTVSFQGRPGPLKARFCAMFAN